MESIYLFICFMMDSNSKILSCWKNGAETTPDLTKIWTTKTNFIKIGAPVCIVEHYTENKLTSFQKPLFWTQRTSKTWHIFDLSDNFLYTPCEKLKMNPFCCVSKTKQKITVMRITHLEYFESFLTNRMVATIKHQ